MSDPSYYRSAEWAHLRRAALKRDGYVCRVLGCKVRGSKNLTVHHIISRANAGSDDVRNLITLCPKHHDDIELSGITQVWQIEQWENRFQPAPTDGSSTILDIPTDDTPEKGMSYVSGRHVCDSLTVAAVNRLKRNGWTWTELAKELGYAPSFSATLSAIAQDKPGAITVEGEDFLRHRLDLIPLNIIKRCRTCGGTHFVSSCPGKVSVSIPTIEREPPKRRRTVSQQELTTAATPISPPPPSAPPPPPNEIEIEEEEKVEPLDYLWERDDTTLGIYVDDAAKFDAIAHFYGKTKRSLFSEMLKMYMEAYNIELCPPEEQTDSDKEIWKLIDEAAEKSGKPPVELFTFIKEHLAAQENPAPPAWVSEAADWLQARLETAS